MVGFRETQSERCCSDRSSLRWSPQARRRACRSPPAAVIPARSRSTRRLPAGDRSPTDRRSRRREPSRPSTPGAPHRRDPDRRTSPAGAGTTTASRPRRPERRVCQRRRRPQLRGQDRGYARVLGTRHAIAAMVAAIPDPNGTYRSVTPATPRAPPGAARREPTTRSSAGAKRLRPRESPGGPFNDAAAGGTHGWGWRRTAASPAGAGSAPTGRRSRRRRPGSSRRRQRL